MSQIDPRWWQKEDPHTYITNYIKSAELYGPSWRSKAVDHARLYSNSNFLGLDPFAYSKVDLDSRLSANSSGTGKIKLNVIGSIIDTLLSNIAGQMPLVNFLPSDADWDTQLRAKRLEKFINSKLVSKKAYTEALMTFLDMCVFGTGCLYPYSEHGELKVDRVLPTELFIDEAESVYGKPRQIHRMRTISRHVALEMFPDHTDAILLASPWEPRAGRYAETSSDIITVRESWHLKSGPDAKDGRFVITIDNATLHDEEYLEDDFPFIFIRWKQPVLGFWGSGIPEELAGIQIEINTILMSIQKAFHLLSNPMVFMPTGSAISKAHINNKIGIIVPFSGPTPPRVVTHQTVHPEVTAHLDRLYERAYQIIGVTQLRAQGRKPGGIDSGKAMREYDDITSQRFVVVSNQWEHLFVELAKKWTKLARKMFEEGEMPEATTKRGKFVRKIKWKEVNLEDDQFVVQIDTSNRLPQSKAGRTQESLELLRAGAITMDEWRDLQNYEDLEGNASLERASRDYIREVIDNLLDEGEYIPPEEYDNLVWARQYAMKMLQQAKMSRAPEDRLDLLRQYIDEVTDMLTPEEQAPDFAPPMPGPAAGPNPTTSPSQLVTPGSVPPMIPSQ